MRTLSALSSVAGLLTFTSLAAAQDFDAAGEQAMLDRINAVRADAQLPALVRMPELDAVARAHSVDMASHGALAHVSETTGTPEDRVHRAGIDARTIAENVALHQDTAHAMEALLASAPHHANILDPRVNHVGLGSVRTPDGGVYVTQVFAEVPPPAPAVVAVAPDTSGDDGSILQIIPPFVQEMLGAAPSVDPAPAAPTPTTAAAPSVAAAPSAPASQPAASPSDAQALPPATVARLRQLVGIAESLLDQGASDAEP